MKNVKLKNLLEALHDIKDEFKHPQVYGAILVSLHSQFQDPEILNYLQPERKDRVITPVQFKNVRYKSQPVDAGCTDCNKVADAIVEGNIIELFEKTEPDGVMAVVQFFAADVELLNTFAREQYGLAVKPGAKQEAVAKQIYLEYGKRKMAR